MLDDRTTQLPDWLQRRALTHPDVVALETPHEVVTYGTLYHQSCHIAKMFRERGIDVGAPVAVHMHDGMTFARTMHALIQVGAPIAPQNIRLSVPELAWQIDNLETRTLLVDHASLAAAKAIVAKVEHAVNIILMESLLARLAPMQSMGATDLNILEGSMKYIDLSAEHAVIYTSGTTGHPKGVRLSYGNHWWAATASALQLGLSPQERWLVPMPLFHVGGLQVLLRSVIYGTTAVIHSKFDPIAVNEALDYGGITLVSLVPTMLARLLDARGNRPFPHTLRCILLGGSAAPQSLLERAFVLGAPISQSYGLTEADSQVCTLTAADSLRKLGSSGKPLIPTEIAIWGDGAFQPPDIPGEILVRGPTVTRGYHARPDANAVSFRDGWFHTGDIGYVDAEGYLFVMDRRSDMIVSGGENIYPAEVESVLLTHSSIVDACVVGAQNDSWGQVPVAFVVFQEGETLTLAELQSYCREHLAGYKTPKALHVVEALPRNASGKLLRKNLRQWMSEQKA